MKRSIVLLLAYLLFFACDSVRPPRVLTVADVRFLDPRKDAIRRHGICEAISYDTAELFVRHPLGRAYFGKIPDRQYFGSGHLFLGYPLEHCTYDTAGNLIYHTKQERFGMMCGTGMFPHYVYDSFGFLINNWKREERYRRDSFSYFIFPGKQQLCKIHWSSEYSWLPIHRSPSTDTIFYELDNIGRPVIGTHHDGYGDDSGWVYTVFDTTWYRYSGNMLAEVKMRTVFPGDTTRNTLQTTNYYYSKGRLDSEISVTKYTNNKWNHKDIMEKTVFDERGLPRTGLIADSLHVFYVLKKCGDTTIEYYRE